MTLVYNHNPGTFKGLSQFSSLKEFNDNYEKWLADLKHLFTKREHNFLTGLKRFGAKVPGIITAKIKTIVAACNKNHLPTSERTGQRTLSKLYKIGIVQKFETKSSKTKLKSANITVFQKYDAAKVAIFLNSQNGGTEYSKNENKETEKVSNSKASVKPAAKVGQNKNGGTLNSLNKAYIKKILNTSKATINSINTKLKIVVQKPIKLLTQNTKPLAFHSRLKDVIYKNGINSKKEVSEIIKLVYGNVYYNTKLPIWKDHEKQMLEHALLVVQDVLINRNSFTIHSLKGFLNYRIKEELEAYMWQNGIREAYQSLGMNI